MAQIAAAKREETEKKLANLNMKGVEKSDMEERKARLMAQREKLKAA